MTPIATGQLSKSGYEMINGPGMLASNVAMGAATLCVALKTKNTGDPRYRHAAGLWKYGYSQRRGAVTGNPGVDH